MTPEQRRDLITVLSRNSLSPTDFVDRIIIPLLAEAWDDGVEWTMAAAGQFTGQPPNPYRPDQTAQAKS